MSDAPDLMDLIKMEREWEMSAPPPPPSAAAPNRQQAKVLDVLRRAGGRGITGWNLLMASHVLRYTERIRELRKIGHVIRCDRTGTTADGESIFTYTLEEARQTWA